METPTLKTYESPELRVYGSVEELTRTKAHCNSNDLFGFIIDIIFGDDGTDIDWGCELS